MIEEINLIFLEKCNTIMVDYYHDQDWTKSQANTKKQHKIEL